MRIEARHYGRAGRCTHSLGNIRILENKALVCQCVKVRDFYIVVAVAGEGIVSLLVTEHENYIRPVCHVALLPQWLLAGWE